MVKKQRECVIICKFTPSNAINTQKTTKINPLNSLEQITKRRGAVLAEYHVTDERLPIVGELGKLAEFIEEFTDFNLNYLLQGFGAVRKDSKVNFNLNPELLKKGSARDWDEYLPSFVRNARNRLGVSQKELAEAMQATGIYRGKGIVNFIYRIEQGATTFRFVDFISLVMAVRSLGYPVTFAEIFGEKAKAEETNVNLLHQKMELLEEEVKQKDEIITRYKNLLSQH